MASHLIIAGHQKCMTTSLYNALARHSSIFNVGHKKELNYFRGRCPTSEGYKTQFKEAGGGVSLEASPFYVFDIDSLRKIDRVLGDSVRVIVLRRDPVERAISHYNHSVIRGWEDKELMVAMKRDIRCQSAYDSEKDRIDHSYLNRSNFDYLEAKAREVLRGRLTVFDTEKMSLLTIEKAILGDVLGFGKTYAVTNVASGTGPQPYKNKSYIVSSKSGFEWLRRTGLRGQTLLRAGILLKALGPGKGIVSERDRAVIREGIENVARLNNSYPTL